MAVYWSLSDKIKLQNKLKQQQNQATKQVQPSQTPAVLQKPSTSLVNGQPVQKTVIDPMTWQPKLDSKGNMMHERQTPTVATPQNPVISKGMGWTFVPNTSDIDSMDKNQLQAFIDTYTVKSKFGSVKEEDAIKAVKAQRLYNEMLKQEQATAPNPYEDMVSQAQAERDRQAKLLEESNMTARQLKERQLQSQFERDKQAQLQAWERQKQASQAASSTTWFGRSTFNADQQAQIQAQTESAINVLDQAKQAELARYDAELQGASAEVLGIMDKNIQDLRKSAYDAQIKAISDADAINKATGASEQESIQNLIATAQAWGMDIKASDEKTITMLSQIVKNPDWTLNEDLLSKLPDWIKDIVKAAATVWYGTQQGEAAKTISIGSGRSERVLQWNPQTGRYDIQVGWWVSWWVSWWGTGWVGWGISWWAWVVDSTQLELISRLQRIQDAVKNNTWIRSSTLLDPNLQSDLNYLKANMTFEKLNEMKARGVKLWVLSDSDMKLLWQAALTITPGMTKDRVIAETNRLMQWLWGNVWTQKPSTPTTPAPTTQSTSTKKSWIPETYEEFLNSL